MFRLCPVYPPLQAQPDRDAASGPDPGSHGLGASFLATAALASFPRWWLDGLFPYDFWMPLYSCCVGNLQNRQGNPPERVVLSVLVKTVTGA